MNKSLSINGVVKHYQELKHSGDIKLIFRKSSIFTHKSMDGKPFYTVRPIVAKIGNWIDDHLSFSFVIKNRFKYTNDSKPVEQSEESQPLPPPNRDQYLKARALIQLYRENQKAKPKRPCSEKQLAALAAGRNKNPRTKKPISQ